MTSAWPLLFPSPCQEIIFYLVVSLTAFLTEKHFVKDCNGWHLKCEAIPRCLKLKCADEKYTCRLYVLFIFQVDEAGFSAYFFPQTSSCRFSWLSVGFGRTRRKAVRSYGMILCSFSALQAFGLPFPCLMSQDSSVHFPQFANDLIFSFTVMCGSV